MADGERALGTLYDESLIPLLLEKAEGGDLSAAPAIAARGTDQLSGMVDGSSPCAMAIGLAFLGDGHAPLDTSCTANQPGGDFSILGGLPCCGPRGG